MTNLLDDSNMAASKLEINFRRLLERCEAMAEEIQDNKENVNWRLDRVGNINDSIKKTVRLFHSTESGPNAFNKIYNQSHRFGRDY